MPTELVTVNLTRENEKEEWGFILTGGGRDKDVRLFIEKVRNLQTITKFLRSTNSLFPNFLFLNY